MTTWSARRFGCLTALAMLGAACTDSNGADTFGTEPDLTANAGSP